MPDENNPQASPESPENKPESASGAEENTEASQETPMASTSSGDIGDQPAKIESSNTGSTPTEPASTTTTSTSSGATVTTETHGPTTVTTASTEAPEETTTDSTASGDTDEKPANTGSTDEGSASTPPASTTTVSTPAGATVTTKTQGPTTVKTGPNGNTIIQEADGLLRDTPQPPVKTLSIPVLFIGGYIIILSLCVLVLLIQLLPPATGIVFSLEASAAPTMTNTPTATDTPTMTFTPTMTATPAGGTSEATSEATNEPISVDAQAAEAGAENPSDSLLNPSATPTIAPTNTLNPDFVPRSYTVLVSTPLTLNADMQLALLVVLSGALGALVHATHSYMVFVGNRELRGSWAGYYLFRPFQGAALALIFYLVIRGGFIPVGGLSASNPFGFLSVAGLVGMFSEQALAKLKTIGTAIFEKAPEYKEPLPASSETGTTQPTVTPTNQEQTPP